VSQEFSQLLRADEAQLDEDVRQAATAALLLALGQLQLDVHQEAGRHELVAKRHFLL